MIRADRDLARRAPPSELRCMRSEPVLSPKWDGSVGRVECPTSNM